MLIRRTFNLPITQNQSLQVCWRKHAHMRRHWLTQTLCQALFNLLFIICKTLGSLTLEFLLYFPGVKADFFSVFLQNFRILLIFFFFSHLRHSILWGCEKMKEILLASVDTYLQVILITSIFQRFRVNNVWFESNNHDFLPPRLAPWEKKGTFFLYLLLSCPFFILPSLVLHTLAIVSL